MQRNSTSHSGFSLVEIAIAIGITAFTLSALIGVFGVSSESALDSSNDTLMTPMIGQIMGDLRSLPFDVIWYANPRTDATYGVKPYLASLPNPTLPTGTPSATDYYFSSEGVMLPSDNTSSHADAIYHCQVTKMPDVNTESFNTGTPVYNRLQLTLRFDWPTPPVGTGSGSNVKLVYESIARYF